jgi:hypothetical protein
MGGLIAIGLCLYVLIGCGAVDAFGWLRGLAVVAAVFLLTPRSGSR